MHGTTWASWSPRRTFCHARSTSSTDRQAGRGHVHTLASDWRHNADIEHHVNVKLPIASVYLNVYLQSLGHSVHVTCLSSYRTQLSEGD